MKKNGEFVGVDDKFIPENEKYVDESIIGNNEESKRKVIKVAKGIGIGYLCFIGFVVIIFLAIFVFVISQFVKVSNTQSKMTDKAEGIFSQIVNQVNEQGDTSQEQINTVQNQRDMGSFNAEFELYSGTRNKMFINNLLDSVARNNKNNNKHIIIVTYNETVTIEVDKIVEIKKSLEEGKDYEVSLDYDAQGFVNKVTIENI